MIKKWGTGDEVVINPSNPNTSSIEAYDGSDGVNQYSLGRAIKNLGINDSELLTHLESGPAYLDGTAQNNGIVYENSFSLTSSDILAGGVTQFAVGPVTGIVSYPISSTTAIVIYNDNTGNANTVVATFNGTVITFGTAVQWAVGISNASITVLTSTLAIATYTYGANTYTRSISISGSAITLNTEYTLAASISSYTKVSFLTATSVIAGYIDASGNAVAVVLTIAGTVITVNSPTTINATTTKSLSIDYIDPANVIAVYTEGNSYVQSRILTISGTTITANTIYPVYNSAASAIPSAISVVSLSTTAATVAYIDTSSQGYAVGLTVAGTVITVNTPVRFVTNAIFSSLKIELSRAGSVNNALLTASSTEKIGITGVPVKVSRTKFVVNTSGTITLGTETQFHRNDSSNYFSSSVLTGGTNMVTFYADEKSFGVSVGSNISGTNITNVYGGYQIAATTAFISFTVNSIPVSTGNNDYFKFTSINGKDYVYWFNKTVANTTPGVSVPTATGSRIVTEVDISASLSVSDVVRLTRLAINATGFINTTVTGGLNNVLMVADLIPGVSNPNLTISCSAITLTSSTSGTVTTKTFLRRNSGGGILGGKIFYNNILLSIAERQLEQAYRLDKPSGEYVYMLQDSASGGYYVLLNKNTSSGFIARTYNNNGLFHTNSITLLNELCADGLFGNYVFSYLGGAFEKFRLESLFDVTGFSGTYYLGYNNSASGPTTYLGTVQPTLSLYTFTSFSTKTFSDTRKMFHGRSNFLSNVSTLNASTDGIGANSAIASISGSISEITPSAVSTTGVPDISKHVIHYFFDAAQKGTTTGAPAIFWDGTQFNINKDIVIWGELTATSNGALTEIVNGNVSITGTTNMGNNLTINNGKFRMTVNSSVTGATPFSAYDSTYNHTASNSSSALYGNSSTVNATHASGTISKLTNYASFMNATGGGSSVVTDMISNSSIVTVSASTTVSNLYHYQVTPASNTGTITTQYGFYANVAGATTNWALYVAAGDVGTALTTLNLFDATATTVNFVRAATTLNIASIATSAQTINIGSSVDTTTAQAFNWGKSTNTVSTFSILPVTASTNTTSGALIVGGGVGVGGMLYVGSSAVIYSKARVYQNITSVPGTFDAGEIFSLNINTANASLSYNGSDTRVMAFGIDTFANSTYIRSFGTLKFENQTNVWFTGGVTISGTAQTIANAIWIA